MRYKNLVYTICLIIIFTSSTACSIEETKSNERESQIIEISPSYAYDINDLYDVIDFNTNIFIGQIVSLDKELTDEFMPTRYYTVDVVLDIKGKTADKINLYNFGGYDEAGNLIVFEGNTLPEVGEYYIFFTLHAYDNYYAIDNPSQKILLTDFAIGDLLTDEQILEVISKLEELEEND